MTTETTQFEFKAEIQQLLEILVHSLYSNKEIFLRELLSNASDALDKLRFEQQSGDIGESETPLEIRIEADKDAGTLTVVDTGIGMTRDEIVANIGTIAHSGTADFVRRMREADSKEKVDSIIGQFGVGFYSIFMVADKVELTTRSAKAEAIAEKWVSDGKGSYEISEVEGDVPTGTSIKLYLKEDEKDYADADRIKDIIKRHSNFINFPIKVGEDHVNTVGALWREPKFQIEQEQYDEFYKFLTFDHEEPMETIHVSADAPIQFNALLFVPKHDQDMLMGGYQGQRGLDLYVRRILIQHENKDIIPDYLGFLRGVVDSEDLPLNISRETLQENLLLQKIGKSVTKHALSHLEKLAKNDAERYAEFWKQHGKVFKLGYADFMNKDKFAALVRFNSSEHEDAQGLTSLAEYVERMKEEQESIYYIAGNTRDVIESNPQLEIFRKKGIEVLYMLEPIDEFVVDSVREFDGKKLVSAEHADLAELDKLEDTADDAEKKEDLSGDEQSSLDELLIKMKEILGDAVTEVKISRRLKDSPVCLVSPDDHMTSSMQKIMRIMSKDESVPQKIMEVNKDNDLIRNLISIFQANPLDEYVELATRQLYESALLLEGYLSDPNALVKRMQEVLTLSSEQKAKK